MRLSIGLFEEEEEEKKDLIAFVLIQSKRIRREISPTRQCYVGKSDDSCRFKSKTERHGMSAEIPV